MKFEIITGPPYEVVERLNNKANFVVYKSSFFDDAEKLVVVGGTSPNVVTPWVHTYSIDEYGVAGSHGESWSDSTKEAIAESRFLARGGVRSKVLVRNIGYVAPTTQQEQIVEDFDLKFQYTASDHSLRISSWTAWPEAGPIYVTAYETSTETYKLFTGTVAQIKQAFVVTQDPENTYTDVQFYSKKWGISASFGTNEPEQDQEVDYSFAGPGLHNMTYFDTSTGKNWSLTGNGFSQNDTVFLVGNYRKVERDLDRVIVDDAYIASVDAVREDKSLMYIVEVKIPTDEGGDDL